MEVITNEYEHNRQCANIHPNLLWCKLLYAVDIWPTEHEGAFMKKGEYSTMLDKKDSKYENELANLRFLTYIDYIPKPKHQNYGYIITELGKKVLQQLKDHFGEENLKIF